MRVNFRGAGRSTGPDTDVTLHTLAADVAGVIDALKIGPGHLVGHAFGNRVARTLTADCPDLVRSVILLAAGGALQPSAEAIQAIQVIFDPASPKSDAIQAMRYMVGAAEDPTEAWDVLKSSRAPQIGPMEMVAGQTTKLEDWWAPPGAQKYLVVQGSDDYVAPPENGELLKQELGARATSVLIPVAGHLLPMTHPDIVVEAIVSFLRAN